MAEHFGTTRDGARVEKCVIAGGGLEVTVITLGAILQDVRLAGVPFSLTLGTPELAAYEQEMGFCGAIVGPVANRISGAKGPIGGVVHDFSSAGGMANALHSGLVGTHAKLWRLADETTDAVTLETTLPDGEGGFPGTRDLTARFEVRGDATLRMTLTSTTDKPTLMNLANHSFWRLSDAATTEGTTLQIAADRYTPGNDAVLPTGEIADVAGTRFDYREPRPLQGGTEGLIDHNFCLSDTRQPLRPVLWLRAPDGLTLEMATTEPGMQVFDGHSLSLPDRQTNDGTAPVPYCAIALEAQHWPDAPNNPTFPSIELHPGQIWEQITEWRFSRAG